MAITYAQPRDPLTGERLRPGTLKLRYAEPRLDNGRLVRLYRDTPEWSPQPLRLHTTQVEDGGPGGGLGGHCFSRDFARYLARVQPASVELAAFERRYWWASAYGRSRVRARFRRQFGPERGELRFQVALALGSGYLGYDELKRTTNHSAYWLREQVAIAAKYHAEPSGYVRAVRPVQFPTNPTNRRDYPDAS